MHAVATLLSLFSILLPTRTWYAPDQPLTVLVKPRPGSAVTLVLTDFTGRIIDGRGVLDFDQEKSVDVKALFQPITLPGTYVLWAVPKGELLPSFVGTPLVINVRDDKRRDAMPGPMVLRVSPLCYAVISTERGDMKIGFYYDVAPHTVANFQNLAGGGFYDGLTFHRVVPEFIVQGGDPRGDGTGGPGYTIGAEFNEREHREGVLSMARSGDPLESQGSMPRNEFANSAGSQFFICLNYDRTRQLDRRYTAFAKVLDGMSAVEAIGKAPIGEGERPATPQVIKSVKVLPVEPGKNPYEAMMKFGSAAPATQP